MFIFNFTVKLPYFAPFSSANNKKLDNIIYFYNITTHAVT